MLIYHSKNVASNKIESNLRKKKPKSTRKQYKSIKKQPSDLIRVKPFEKKQQKKRKKQPSKKLLGKKQSRKKLSDKNRKFLEKLGLSVKPQK